MFSLIHEYKVKSFFNEKTRPFDHQFLCYKNDYEECKENNKKLLFKESVDEECVEISSWGYLFKKYIPKDYWKNLRGELAKEREIPGFSDIDYYNVNDLINKIFFILDINKETHYYRKELTKFYCQYQTLHYKSSDKTRLYCLKRLLDEMWISDLSYNRLIIKDNEFIYTTESGVSYCIHDLIDRLCDIIRTFSLPKNLLAILDFINLMLHECIDFILGKDGDHVFYFGDFNIKYINGDYFYDVYENDKDIIFNVLKDCVRDYQSFSELFISHMIMMNYSYFVLKNKPDEILLFKSFLNNNDETFTKILSLTIDIGFCVWTDTFDGLNLEEYLKKVEESDFLIDK
ncbi:hypothetical protein [Xenorhabdus bovienii]|uniref:Uncharacterized protein n=1 Tax=Xenorhabdus bovienii str. Intermedium TaxID=1379677 RepID=A0A077QD14_XENBV|nr:hypothetical protein [Xenorhabdus bovienii]CDH34027.1 conserved hypothetical protein [Xenorhabdus bovienii str. Intermedium]